MIGLIVSEQYEVNCKYVLSPESHDSGFVCSEYWMLRISVMNGTAFLIQTRIEKDFVSTLRAIF